MHDIIIAGAGPAGLTAAITAARAGASVLVLESGPAVGRKLLVSGGGRCNVTNTLPVDEFMERFGRHGRFMQPALVQLDSDGLCGFLRQLGVETHAPDGFHVFPTGHSARSVLDALTAELSRLRVEIRTDSPVIDLDVQDGHVRCVCTTSEILPSRAVILACGGRGYPSLGGNDSGCRLAETFGHRIAPCHPGMVALQTKEDWPSRCTANTVPRATLRIRRPGKQRIEGCGDLIFTRDGLAGPVVLDLAREITPLLATDGEQVLEMELTGRTQMQWLAGLSDARRDAPQASVVSWLSSGGEVAPSLGAVICALADVDPDTPLERLGRKPLAHLAEKLARIHVTVTGHAGWDGAMVMRGGVSLREVRPETLESRRVRRLYLAGELLDLDGPCGGFNLQWAFASGHLAGLSAAVC